MTIELLEATFCIDQVVVWHLWQDLVLNELINCALVIFYKYEDRIFQK